MTDTPQTPVGVAAEFALVWITGSVTEALAAWDQGRLAELPVGATWEVVRMPRRLGWRTVDCLRAMGAVIGPVLHSEKWVDVLVPAGSVDGWDQDEATVLGEGETISVPHPSFVAPRTHHARSWIVPPAGAALTDGAALYEAFAAVLVSLHMDAAR
jgi:hypothetical protein